ncbi:unnamed protein product [Trichobilharzia regenti]|nr:unnamed protein product [Trichobilharzia regenti]
MGCNAILTIVLTIQADNLCAYKKADIVEVEFVSASPRNNIRSNGTYLTVERLDETLQKWDIFHTDANWETK